MMTEMMVHDGSLPPRLKILIVDDDADVLGIIRQIIILKYQHAEVETARNGIEALEKLEKNNDVDAIITDFKMPVIRGDNLCFIIKEKFPTITIALMTAFSGDITAPFDKVFFKPLDFDDLFSFIQSVMEKKRPREKPDAT